MVKTKGLSAYEQLREDNISRNAAFLTSLGLDEVRPVVQPKPTRRRGRNDDDSSEDGEDYDEDSDKDGGDGENSRSKKSKRSRGKSSLKAQAEPTRRSTRTAGNLSEHQELLQLDDTNGTRGVRQSKPLPSFSIDVNVDDEGVDRKKITASSLRSLIDAKNAEHSEAVSDEVILHTVYRISSMSNKALSTRVKMIARAQGKNSREKLLAFFYGLLGAGLEDLAKSCWEACKYNGAITSS